MLTLHHHLVALCKHTSSNTTLLKQLAGSGLGTGAKTLHTAALSLVNSIAEYCAPVWCHSINTCLIDSVLYDILCIITGYLHPTSMDHLPLLSGIQTAELFQIGVTLFFGNGGSLDPDHMLNPKIGHRISKNVHLPNKSTHFPY